MQIFYLQNIPSIWPFLPTSAVATLVHAIFILYLDYFFLHPPLLAYNLVSWTWVTYKQKSDQVLCLHRTLHWFLIFSRVKHQSSYTGLQGLTQSVPHTAFLLWIYLLLIFATLTLLLFSNTEVTFFLRTLALTETHSLGICETDLHLLQAFAQLSPFSWALTLCFWNSSLLSHHALFVLQSTSQILMYSGM